MAYSFQNKKARLFPSSNQEKTGFQMMLKSIELRAGRNLFINHQQVELLLALLLVDGGKEHTAGIDTHHRARRQVGDGNQRLADQFFRLIERMNAGENHAVGTGAVVQRELEQLLALFHRFAGFDLHRAEIALGEGFKIHVIREQRLDFHLAEIDDRLFGGFFLLLLLRFGLDDRRGGGRGQRLHRRDFKLTLFANQFFLIYLYFQSTFVSRPYYTFTPIRMSFVSSGVSIGVKWRM